MSTTFKLVLGTAQLGFPYGISNKVGQPDQATATEIIRQAWDSGIRQFDTAQAYGIAEEVLGKAFFELGLLGKAQVISKFDPTLDYFSLSDMSRALNRSLDSLGIPSLFCMLLHSEDILSFWNNGLVKIFQNLLLNGKVKKLGVSVYSPGKAIEALKTEYIDVVQLPTNILDRRFENAGVFQLADEMEKDIYIRSIFLQGLLLMKPEEIPAKMAFARPIIEKFESLSNDLGLSRLEVAMGYIKSEMPNTYVIFGAETKNQVNENVNAWEGEMPESLNKEIKKCFMNVGEEVLNPVLWFKK